MPITSALAVLAVSDLEEAKEFYGRLFARPADVEPMPNLTRSRSGRRHSGFPVVP